MREERGITLIALVITVIILIILAGIGIGSVGGLRGDITNADDTVAVTNIKKVQQAVLEAYIMYKQTENINFLKGTKMEYSEAQNIAAQFNELIENINIELKQTNSTDDDKCYYRIAPQNLKELGMTNTVSQDEYMVNYSTGEVFNITRKKSVSGDILYVHVD